MDILKKYVVYELNQIMGSEKHLSLERVRFKGFSAIGFDTEEDAIQALIDEKKIYQDYVILKQVFIREE